ncbi:hypothetical protein ABIA00_000186 [Bradyrhizobium ottawaense]|uniref:hypothetical protein n=1 Tax=Bradyrhizobium ottawaense TaxID=931866 RepID=UPI003835490B
MTMVAGMGNVIIPKSLFSDISPIHVTGCLISSGDTPFAFAAQAVGNLFKASYGGIWVMTV